jgi:hypothetical protein
VSLTDPPARPDDDPLRSAPGAARRERGPALPASDSGELDARVSARQVEETVHLGSFVLLGVGLLIAAAVAAMLVVAWA